MKNLLAVKYADGTTLYDLDEEMEVKAIVFRYDLKEHTVEIVWEHENEEGHTVETYEYCNLYDEYVSELDSICMKFGDLSSYGNKKMSVQTFIF